MASENDVGIEQTAYTLDKGSFNQKITFIRSELNNNKVVDLNDSITIWDFNGGVNQQWEFLYDTLKMSYQIVSVESGEAMASTAAGQVIMIRPNYGSSYDPAGYWQLRKINNTNYYVLWNVGSSRVLDLTGSNTQNGTSLQTYYDISSAAQMWYIG